MKEKGTFSFTWKINLTISQKSLLPFHSCEQHMLNVVSKSRVRQW